MEVQPAIDLRSSRRGVLQVLSAEIELMQLPASAWPDHIRQELGLTIPAHEFGTVGECIQLLLAPLADHQREEGRKIERMLIDTVLDIQAMFGSIDRLPTLQIVDIACGARVSTDAQWGVRYEPWRARLLAKLGAHVIGIDFRESSNEPYLHQVSDLKTDLLSGVASQSCDLAICCGYYWLRPQDQWFGGTAEQQHVAALRSDIRRVLRLGGMLYDGRSIIERVDFQ